MSEVTSILSHPQRALASTISAGHEIIQLAQNDLLRKASLPEFGKDTASLKWIDRTIDTYKESIKSRIAVMNAATAQVVTLSSSDIGNMDHTAIGAAITTITSNIPEIAKGVQIIAALMVDESVGNKLLDAARKLCLAFTDLLKATEPDATMVR